MSGFFVAYCGVQAMVVTLGGSFLYSGIALLVSNMASTESYQGISGFPDNFKILSKYKLFGLIPSQLDVYKRQQYKRLTGLYEGVLTGKGLTYGGSLARTEATGCLLYTSYHSFWNQRK